MLTGATLRDRHYWYVAAMIGPLDLYGSFAHISLNDWFPTSKERRNSMAWIGAHWSVGVAWTDGTRVSFHIDGVPCFTGRGSPFEPGAS